MSYQAISFKSVLPSAIGLMLIGISIAGFYQPWSWTGQLGLLVVPIGVTFGALLYLAMFSLSAIPMLRIDSAQSLLLMLHQLFKNLTWTQIIVVSLLAGIGEEILIRGALQSFLVSLSSPLLGIIAASLVFGLLHFLTKMYVLLTFVMGLMFAVVFHLTNSMIVVMLAHTVYDILAFTMIVKFPEKLGLAPPADNIAIHDQLH